MKRAVITGANRGIGYEVARQLLQNGVFVFLGCRNLSNGELAVSNFKKEGLLNCEAVELDVTDDASVQAAFDHITQKTDTLDILINNAAISGGLNQPPLSTSVERFKAVYDTNVFGVVRVTQRFVDLLRRSNEPRIVNVTSGLGSLTLASDPTSRFYHASGSVYHSSKAALNMYTVNLAYELRDSKFKVNAVCPGYTKTDLNNNQGTGCVEDAARRIIKYALLPQSGPSGQFFCEDINPETGAIPW